MRSSEYQRFWENESFAFVGHSEKSGFPRLSFAELTAKGREAYAVDPSVETVDAHPAYSSFEDLPAPVSAAVIEVPKEETQDWVGRAADAGIKQVWIHQGRDTPEALALADERGLTVYSGTCAVMYVKEGFSYHSIHRGIMKLLGKF